MKVLKGILLTLAAFFVASVFLLPKSLSAQTQTKGIQISPVTYNFEIKPGDSQVATVTVTNLNDEALNYVCETENFSYVSEEGAPSFAGADLKEGVTSLADWISFDANKEGVIQSKKSAEVTFSISVPIGAEPGGHYAAVFAKQIKKTPEGKTEIGVTSRVGTLILVSVPGATTKTAEITEFKSPKFVWHGPVDFSMKVKNTGTVHYDSVAKVKIDPLIGNNTEVDLGKHTLIPKNIRSFEGTWNKKYPFNYYKITAEATDGDGNPVTTTAVMWAIPLIIVIPVLLGIILLILLIVWIKKKFRIVAK